MSYIQIPGLPGYGVHLSQIQEGEINLPITVPINSGSSISRYPCKKKTYTVKLGGLTKDKIAKLEQYQSNGVKWKNIFSGLEGDIILQKVKLSALITVNNQQIADSTTLVYETVKMFI
ncbi:hypothetical protein [Coleofasciculus sp. FACHB-T130]|uniref:hypothetical protein n=1 Tax=Cyanophyceae TaxID=3028117 RepID=UPI001688DEA0|nr:hypothetical protein [Coleofasciculus sp. FACHB-T130]MBD1877967.1 hypothetical protein [Coleofasciculus sp. FACHB-T130]